jgi:hypothetical protein
LFVDTRANDRQKSRRTRNRLLFIAVLIVTGLFLLLLFRHRGVSQPGEPVSDEHITSETKPTRDTLSADTVPGMDTVIAPDTVTSPAKSILPRKKPPIKVDTAAGIDTLQPDTAVSVQPDSQQMMVSDSGCTDTIAPWVYPDPSGGLHYDTVHVFLKATEPCTIEWRFGQDSLWSTYTGRSITIGAAATLLFRAVDTCGNRLDSRTEVYEIEKRPVSQFCPSDMELVKVAQTEFCIDRYEWPNRKGVKPLAYISLYHAMDSCFAAGKRLCSTEEWKLACSGPYSWRYPYGQVYEGRACTTHDTTVRASGSKPECRGYFGVYDMSGGLQEWTATRSSQDRNFYNVMGGFWESGSASSCFDTRYSYFPQNRHNPVGFRCCKDRTQEEPAGTGSGKGKNR